jgi:hypothetical protein
MRLRGAAGAAAGEFFKPLDISSYQRLLLDPGPTFDLSLCGNGVFDAVKFLREYQLNGPSPRGIAVISTSIMLSDALVE